MKKIMFGNSLMLLGIAIMILAGLELIYIGIMLSLIHISEPTRRS